MSNNGANGGTGLVGIPDNVLGLFGAATVIVIMLGLIESVIGFVCVASCPEVMPVVVGIHGIFVVVLEYITMYFFFKANKKFFGCCICLAVSAITIASILTERSECRSQNYYSVGALVITILESILVMFTLTAAVCCCLMCN